MLKARKTAASETVVQRGSLQRDRASKSGPVGSAEFSISGNSPNSVRQPDYGGTNASVSRRTDEGFGPDLLTLRNG